ncbi:MAG: hypothetical protein FWF60_06115 [Oscillospiraceae bacterium]|nr:hypothetical protein [Oscillospiraceae bacterium]
MKKALSALLAAVMVLGLLALAPITAHAATGMATINVSTLGGANADNSAASATESQWAYSGSSKQLQLNTAGGNYTLTGANSNLNVRAGNVENVTLNGVSITWPGSDSVRGALVLNSGNGRCTVTLVGSNTLTSGYGGSGGGFYMMSGSLTCTITSATGGSLTATGNAGCYGLYTSISATNVLRITGNASFTAVGGAGQLGSSGFSLELSDSAKLMITNNSAVAEEEMFAKADTADTCHWKLTNATLTDGAVGDDYVEASIAAGQTATVEREAHVPGSWIVDTPATHTTTGSQHKECTVCGYVMETQVIPATGGGGDTGDYFKLWGKTTKYLKSNFWNWILLIVCFGWIWMAF